MEKKPFLIFNLCFNIVEWHLLHLCSFVCVFVCDNRHHSDNILWMFCGFVICFICTEDAFIFTILLTRGKNDYFNGGIFASFFFFFPFRTGMRSECIANGLTFFSMDSLRFLFELILNPYFIRNEKKNCGKMFHHHNSHVNRNE